MTKARILLKADLSDAREGWLYAFDLLELDGVDYRPLPLRQRKDRLARLLTRVQGGIALNERTDEDGAVVFLHASVPGSAAYDSRTAHLLLHNAPSAPELRHSSGVPSS